MLIWDHTNLCNYFELPPWGLDFMKAYQALSTQTSPNHLAVINFKSKNSFWKLRLKLKPQPEATLLLQQSLSDQPLIHA